MRMLVFTPPIHTSHSHLAFTPLLPQVHAGQHAHAGPPFHTSYSHLSFTPPIHAFASFHRYTLASMRMLDLPFTPPIHTSHSRLPFTPLLPQVYAGQNPHAGPPFHTSHSHLSFTPPIHAFASTGIRWPACACWSRTRLLPEPELSPPEQ